MMTLLKRIETERLLFDGAMGTMLEPALLGGCPPDILNITDAGAVLDVHMQYLKGGAQIIKTNTFGANRLKLAPYRYSVGDVVAEGVKIAQEAIQKSGELAYVALDIGPSGKLLKPLGDLDFEDAVALFSEMVEAGHKNADCILIETMSDTYELKAAVLAAREVCDLPVFVTMTLDERGRLLTGGDIYAACTMLEGLNVSAVGLNCGMGPHQMAPHIKALYAHSSLPIIANPNAGLPKAISGKTVYDLSPDDFAAVMAEIAPYTMILGGCCGTTPEHIQRLRETCGSIPPAKLVPKDTLFVSSYSQAVEIGKSPVIIGERINPTGKKRFKQALLEHDIDYILREGVSQQDKGAHILDVNVGLPEIDEGTVLPEVIERLQSITPLPLQIDTSDYDAMERAMRVYNGKPLINSVNGKLESMQRVFPLVKKYGGAVVALTLDENGIPETAEERLSIAKKIVDTAQRYGISRRDILFDTLTLPASTSKDAAGTTLKALSLIHEQLSCRTVLGVSNVSFGLPSRERINAAFYLLALNAGLSAAILNPLNEQIMGAYYTYCALMGFDPNCARFIARYQGEQAPSPAPLNAQEGEMSLYQAVLKGMREDAAAITKSLLQKQDPMTLINEALVPALDEVGLGFEQGRVFLPQLMMSAEAAKAAFEIVKQHLPQDTTGHKKGRILIATVRGDIHDIGKNIVKVLLQNYQFDVIDLGKDVHEEDIVAAAIENEVSLIGLSALMTTTAPAMASTIARLNEKLPSAKVVVGGAVLNEEYAKSIKADFYARDAMATVNYAQRHFGGES